MIKEISDKMSMICYDLRVILKNQLKRMTFTNLRKEELQR